MLHWLRPHDWPHAHTILKEAARFTLAISVFGIALRTPKENYRHLLRPLGLLLTLGRIVMWLASARLAWAFLGLSPIMALLLGAIVTPTDPVVASSIVTGPLAEPSLPDRLRSTLSLGSGANDGLACQSARNLGSDSDLVQVTWGDTTLRQLSWEVADGVWDGPMGVPARRAEG